MGSMMVVKDALVALDTMEREPSPFEVDLLETMTAPGAGGAPALPETAPHPLRNGGEISGEYRHAARLTGRGGYERKGSAMTAQQLAALHSLLQNYWPRLAPEVLPTHTLARWAPIWSELAWASLDRYGLTRLSPPNVHDLMVACMDILDEQAKIIIASYQEAKTEEPAP